MPTASETTGTNTTRSLIQDDLLSTDYYDDVTTVPDTRPTFGGTSQKCDYDSCRENQLSCMTLAKDNGCLCPGFTLGNRIPLAPDLRAVSWNGSEVVVKWCAPYSYITHYIVKVGGQKSWMFREDQRSAAVGDIDDVANVCVVAVNNAGESEACMMYHPRDKNLSLKAGLIGGALGFLLLLLLAILIWRHKRQRKQETGFSMHDTTVTG